jgi:hypothetical protein
MVALSGENVLEVARGMTMAASSECGKWKRARVLGQHLEVRGQSLPHDSGR